MLYVLAGILIFGIAYHVNDWLRERRRRANPVMDRGAGNPNFAPGLDLIWKQDWAGLSALYRKQTPSDRYQFIEALAAASVIDITLSKTEADSAALTIQGGFKVGQAWRFRGASAASTVSQSSAQRFTDSLNEARLLLESALAINPQDSTAMAFLIRTRMGLSRDTGSLDALIGQAEASFERNLFVAANHIQFVAPKWHGSVETMWTAANHWASTGPNAAWLAIAARAHTEEWLFATGFDRPGGAAKVAHMHDKGFHDHIAALDDDFWKRTEVQPIAGAEASFAHNNFAFLLHNIGMGQRAARHLDKIGPHITELPWGYLPTSAEEPMYFLGTLRKKYKLARLQPSGARRR